jgi:predicted RecB family endonuclease
MADGKQLEALVQFIVSILVPNGFEIEARERVLDDARRQIAEFDVVTRGNVGSTDFTWSIECRQKPICLSALCLGINMIRNVKSN